MLNINFGKSKNEKMEKPKMPSQREVQIIDLMLRLSGELNETVSALAKSTGASYNCTLCLLIRLGLKHFEPFQTLILEGEKKESVGKKIKKYFGKSKNEKMKKPKMLSKGEEQIIDLMLRLSGELDETVSALAKSTGASYNCTLCLLIRLGLKDFEPFQTLILEGEKKGA